MPVAPELTTSRLRLRLVRPADAPEIARECGHLEVASQLLDVPSPYTVAQATQWVMRRLERAGTGGGPTLAIEAGARLLGTVALRFHRRDSRAELGYWLRRDAWGQGYATEAGQALVSWGFAQGLVRIYARVLTRNTASMRVLQKLGMTQEGVLRQHVRHGQALCDVALFGVLFDEWHR